MEHAWLDSLSEDWVSQPASEGSPPQLPAGKDVENHRPSSLGGAESRLARSAFGGKPSQMSMADNSVNILSERSLNDVNVPPSQRGPSKLSQEIKFPDRGRHISRTFSASTNGSVVHNTVQHKSMSASPYKSRGQTPEWKRRLVHGDLAYGEQKDLFCSAPNGLENIFRPPVPPAERHDEEDSNRNETTLPSSPPPYRGGGRRAAAYEDSEQSSEPSFAPESLERPPARMKYRMTGDDSAMHSRNSDFSIRPDTEEDSQGQQSASETGFSGLPIGDSMEPVSGELRKASGQSVARNEDFSPIVLSQRHSGNGKVDFAPIELPADQLRSKLERLRINQMLLDSQTAANLDLEINDEETSQAIETTEDYARQGGFVNWRRGGRSADDSFRHRLLSPGIGTDTSEMLLEESLQASTPKQFPTIRLDGPDSLSRTVSRSPSLLRAPNPSPEKLSQNRLGANGSPLKLFGPYDTFTNQTLMRRISQFEEHTSGSSRMSAGVALEDVSGSEVDQAFVAPSSPQKQGERRPHAQTPHPRAVSKFGVGDLEGFQFNEDISYASYDGSSAGDLDLLDGESGPNFSILHSSSPRDAEELVIKRKRHKSSATPSSRHGHSEIQDVEGDSYIGIPPRPDVPSTPKKRDTTSDGKRPRTSPSKDPTPKRRRTLHKSDVAYGLEEHLNLMESMQEPGAHSAMGKKRKDARPGDMQQLANPNVMAVRQILRPRTPTPSQRSSVQREQHPFVDTMPIIKSSRRSPQRGLAPAESIAQNNGGAETDRKPSIKTQDFLDEAGKIMAMIRNQVKPPSGLTSVEESEAEMGGQSPALDDSFQESTKEPFSRPPSRDGAPVTRLPARQDDPDILDHLKKYQERSDFGDLVSSSLRSMNMARSALRKAEEIDGQLRESIRARSRLDNVPEDEVFSDPPNIRITGPTVDDTEARSKGGAEFPSHSSGHSTNRTIPTGSSGASDSKNFIPPQNVSHIIPDQLGGMCLDREKNVWIRNKARAPSHHGLASEASEDDPFADIPDLSVDMTREMQNLRILRAREELAEGADSLMSSASLLKTPRGRAARSYATVSPDAALNQDLASPARDELRKLEAKGIHSLADAHDNDVEHEIRLDEDRVSTATPSRRRNLTISFSSPIASIIQDVVSEDIEGMDDDPSLKLDALRLLGEESPSKNGATSLTRSLRRKLVQRARSASRGASRQLSVSGQVFVPRPVSRIDEREEDSVVVHDRQVSLVGDQSIVSQRRDPHRASVNFVVSTHGALASVHADASAIISQNVGNLSLSPLSEFTMDHGEQSFGFEVSYIVGSRHLVTGDGSKKVMSMTVRDLVDRLSEAEPFEPYWEDLRQLDLHDRRLSSLHMLDEFCGALVTLDASENALSHLDGIPSTVRELKVTHNMITELTSWGHLANLQYVDISNNEVKSLHALKGLVHLRNLKADNNQLTSLDGVNYHDGLLSLRARDNLIEEVDFDGTMLHRLTELDLSGNQITTIRCVEQLTSLQTLKLPQNKLESFTTGADGLPNVRHMDLSDNALASLDVSRMPSLRVLHADRNSISSLSGFTKARRLDSLSLREQRGGQPLDLTFLAAAYEIRKLYLSGNYLGAFDPKVDFLNLQLLELANCGLRSLPASMGQLMPNLRTLNLNFNAVADLAPLRFIPRLKKLLAAGNRLADATAATEVLTEHPHLARLDLRDNPMTQGFYPPPQALVGPDGAGALGGDFALPEADPARDERFAGRLDEATRLRRRLYQVVFAERCGRLRVLDGLPVRRQQLLVRDAALEALVGEGVLPPELIGEEPGPPPASPGKPPGRWAREPGEPGG